MLSGHPGHLTDAPLSVINAPCCTLLRARATRSRIVARHSQSRGLGLGRPVHARFPLRTPSKRRGSNRRPVFERRLYKSAHRSARVRRRHTPAVGAPLVGALARRDFIPGQKGQARGPPLRCTHMYQHAVGGVSLAAVAGDGIAVVDMMIWKRTKTVKKDDGAAR